MGERHHVPPAGRAPIGGGPRAPLAGAVDLSEARSAPRGPGKMDFQILTTYALTSCTDVDEWFPAFGMVRDDGQTVPFLMFTAEDGVARAYILHEGAEAMLRNFIVGIDTDRAERAEAAALAAKNEEAKVVDDEAELDVDPRLP